MRKRRSLAEFKAGILAGDRVVLAQAITLVESELPEDQILATNLIQEILPFTGNSFRIGITGVPGVGKSSFIEVFGTRQLDAGKKVAVLAVDPSSSLSKVLYLTSVSVSFCHNLKSYFMRRLSIYSSFLAHFLTKHPWRILCKTIHRLMTKLSVVFAPRS